MLPSIPNPFSDLGTIRYELAAPAHVDLRLYDILGRVVRVLEAGTPKTRGLQQHAVWDGRDDRGRILAAGVYFYRVETGTRSETDSIVFLEP